jgi:hypothetical protein
MSFLLQTPWLAIFWARTLSLVAKQIAAKVVAAEYL